MGACREKGCGRPVSSRGLCSRHYAQVRRAGGTGAGQDCKEHGCGKPATARGWCPNHYEKWRRRGTPSGLRNWGEATDHPFRNTWVRMKGRCNRPNDPAYGAYGGRGIKVSERWSNDFWAFVDDMGPRPSPAHTLDRIDVDGDYEPKNCRWADKTEQSRNRRLVQMTDRLAEEARRRYEFGDTVADIARSLRISYGVAYATVTGKTWTNTPDGSG